MTANAANDDRTPCPSPSELLPRHLPAVRRFLGRTAGAAHVNRDSLTDLAQSVCREALQDWSDFDYRGEAAFRRWLLLLAERKVRNRRRYFRQAIRDIARERPLDSVPSSDLRRAPADECTPARRAIAREELSRVERAIRKLPARQREALQWSRIAGMDTNQVAKQLGCTPSAVRGLIARGLMTVTAELDGSSAEAPASRP